MIAIIIVCLLNGLIGKTCFFFIFYILWPISSNKCKYFLCISHILSTGNKIPDGDQGNLELLHILSEQHVRLESSEYEIVKGSFFKVIWEGSESNIKEGPQPRSKLGISRNYINLLFSEI